MAFLICFITSFVSGLGLGGGVSISVPTFSFGFNLGKSSLIDTDSKILDEADFSLQTAIEVITGKSDSEAAVQAIVALLVVLVSLYLIFILIVGLIKIVIQIFVVNPVNVGMRSYFISFRGGLKQFRALGYAFSSGRYMQVVRAMFMKDLYISLWALLFIIPGIVKYYSYFLVPFIVAENPSLSTTRILEISKQTMKGKKWKLFVLQLSFIGWAILSVLSFGIGFYFLNPYMRATETEFYECAKKEAANSGILSAGELPVSA